MTAAFVPSIAGDAPGDPDSGKPPALQSHIGGSASTGSFDPDRAGCAWLEVRQVNDRSILSRFHATSPLRILNPQTRSPAAWLFASSFGGGLLAGDHLSIRLLAGEGTTTYLSTQSSTKIYRSAIILPARQSLHATVNDHATLILLPDPLVPFAFSRYEQAQRFYLASTSNLILLDAFTSGRHARGERWNLTSLRSRNEITVGNRRILTDTLLLSSELPLTGPFRLGEFDYFATLVLAGPKFRPHSQRLLRHIHQLPIAPDSPLVVAASPLGDGIFLRLASTSTELATKALHDALAFLPEILGEHPWNRKW